MLEEVAVAAPDYEAMSVPELEKVVDQESNSAPATQATETAPEATTTPAVQSAPTIEQRIEELNKRLEERETNLKRELGTFRSQQSRFDQLPQMIQQQIQSQLAAFQQAQQQAQLNPEDQQAQLQQAQQHQMLQAMINQTLNQNFDQLLASRYGPQIQALTQFQEQQQTQQYFQSVLQTLGADMPDAPKVLADLFKSKAEAIKNGDQAALEWMTRAEKEPALVALEAMKQKASSLKTANNQVVSDRQKAGEAAAAGPKAGAVSNSGKKSVSEMTDAELDKMSTKELEAALAEAGA